MGGGIYTAASGAIAQSESLEVIANNLANADTPAFKKDMPTFREYLSVAEHPSAVMDIPRGPIRDKDFYPLDGRDQSFVVMDGTHTSHRQGNLRVTHLPLDIALEGKGFIEVLTPNGVRYTRQGSLKLGADGKLLTSQGFMVLARDDRSQAAVDDPNPQGRALSLAAQPSKLAINAEGEIYAGDQFLGQISIVEFQQIERLKKHGNELFENRDPANRLMPSPGAPNSTLVHQGLLEHSNVNPIEEMGRLIQAHRLFEHDLKAIKTYGEMLAKESNEIGKL